MAPRQQKSRVAGILIFALALGIFAHPAWATDRAPLRLQRRYDAPPKQSGIARTALLIGLAVTTLAVTKCTPVADQQANPKDWTPDVCRVAYPMYPENASPAVGAWARGKVLVSIPGANLHLVSLSETGVGAGHPASTKPLAQIAQALGQTTWHPTTGTFVEWKSGTNLQWPQGGCSGAKKAYGGHVWDAGAWTVGQVGNLLGWAVEGVTTTAPTPKK